MARHVAKTLESDKAQMTRLKGADPSLYDLPFLDLNGLRGTIIAYRLRSQSPALDVRSGNFHAANGGFRACTQWLHSA